MSNVTDMGNETLVDRARKWAREMRNQATGPLVIAREVCELAERWSDFEGEAAADMGREKATATAYLKFKLGQGLPFWERRARAVARLGESCRRTIHHDAAKWIVDNVADEKIDAVKFASIRACKENNGIPVSWQVVQRIARKLLGAHAKPARPAECERCKHLEEIIRQHGLSVE